jgi:hypothetical protein
VSNFLTTIERISSTMTEKTKSCTAKEGRESQDKPLMTSRLSIIAKEDNELHGGSSRVIGILNIRRTEKRHSCC